MRAVRPSRELTPADLPPSPDAPVAEQLAWLFRRNGYVRRQDPERLASEGYRDYKKGDEVRLVADSVAELRTIRRLLRRAGFNPGRPFVKGRQWRQPLYGRDAVARFLALVGEVLAPNPSP